MAVLYGYVVVDMLISQFSFGLVRRRTLDYLIKILNAQ